MTSGSTSSRAQDLHRQAIVIDAHSDILIPIADRKIRLRDRVQVPDPAAWEPPIGLPGLRPGDAVDFLPYTRHFSTMGQYSIPQFLAGGLTVQTCAVYLQDEHLDQALQRGLEMTYWLHREISDNDELDLIRNIDDIYRIKREGKVGALLSLEGFEVLGSKIEFLDLYYKLGLRMASLTHCRRNLYADGVQKSVDTGGLTVLGRRAVRRMNELGIIVDLAHINEAGFWEILAISQDPVVLSHSTGTMFPAVDLTDEEMLGARPGLDRNRDRERLEALARNGGVLGLIWFFKQDLESVIADIELALEIMGPEHIGLGTDLYGLELAPAGLEDISKLPSLTQRMVERGHSDELILKFLGGNYLRVFEQVWR